MIINGAVETKIDARDRGLQYGDGCFTTLLTLHGKLCHWPQHKARLNKALKRLNIEFEQWQRLEQELNKTIPQAPRGVMKVVITRGVGGRGYSPDGCSQSQWIISTSDYPSHYLNWQQRGVHLETSTISLAQQPLLAGIKHLNRLEQIMIKQAAQTQSADDVVVCDTQGNIVETSASNMFWLNKGVWFTPSLNQCGVEGVMRNLLIDRMTENGLVVEQVFSPVSALQQAEAAFICNSLMQIVPVHSYGSTDYTMDQIHALQEKNWC